MIGQSGADDMPVRCLHGAIDGVSYSGRSSPRQHDMQDRIATSVERAARNAGLDSAGWWVQPQGDGELIRFPRDLDEASIVAGLTRELAFELDAVNRDLLPSARLRLRLAYHVGVSHEARLGLAGDAPVVVSRLLNALALRRCLAAEPERPLAVIVSEPIYQDVIRHRFRGLDPDAWTRVHVRDDEKGFDCPAWVTVVGAGDAPRGDGRHRPWSTPRTDTRTEAPREADMEPMSTMAVAALILASRGSAEELGTQAGRAAWSGLRRLEELVRARFRDDRDASSALCAAETNPEDRQAVARLRAALEAYAGEDAEFRAEVTRLVEDARSRPEYRPGSTVLQSIGWVGKINIFEAPIHLDHGDFVIN